MTSIRLATLLVGGTSQPWLALGFVLDQHGRIPVNNGALEFTGSGSGLLALSVAGLDTSVGLDGIVVAAGAARSAWPAIDHPNGAFELDHVVVMTDSLERTSDAVAVVLGCERRRTRDTGDQRQAFHRLGPGGVILEIVEREGVTGVGLFGVVFTVVDLDAVVAAHDRDVLGLAKDATQPGRRIASVRSGAGLGVPTAFMSPNL